MPLCVSCGASFAPRNRLQKYCPSCIEQSHICVDCGVVKHRSARGPRCRKCTDLNTIGKPRPWNRRPEKPIEQVIAEVEAFGLLPEKQYAFGYVMGVVFGDGCVSRETISQSHIRSDGTRSTRRSSIRRVRLQVTSQAFAERFAKQWEYLTGKPTKVYTNIRAYFSKSTLEQYSLQLFNVRQGHILLTRYLAYLKYESDPLVLLRLPLVVMRGFVHGMIDSEGHMRSDGRIDIANKDIRLLDTLVKMLALLDCKSTVCTSPSQRISHLYTRIPYIKYGYDEHQ